MSTRTRPASGAVALAEMKEFGGFAKGTQRYIRRSLDVGLDRRDAVKRWSRDPAEAASIRAQESVYRRLDHIRSYVPDDSGIDAMEPMMAPPAMQQGELLAKNIDRIIHKKPLKPFRYDDKGSMATVGRNKAVVDMKKFKFQGFFAWFVWMFVHLLSLIGFRNKLIVFINWLVSYFSYDKSNRLIIARPKDGVH